MNARSRSAPTSDIIEIPRKLEGCVVQTHHPVKPGDLDRYYNYAPFYFKYNEPIATGIKQHVFRFHVGLVTSDTNTILVDKAMTYLQFGIRSDADVDRLTTELNRIKPSGPVSRWFLPFLQTIIEMNENSIVGAIVDAIQSNATPDGEIELSPSEIAKTITITPVICRKKGRTLIHIEQSFIDEQLSHKEGSMKYEIYFTFQMKPRAEPYTTKRILHRFCMKKADGSEETRYITQLPSGEYVSTQEEGKPRVYNRAEPPFRYVGGKRKTRRRRNRTSK